MRRATIFSGAARRMLSGEVDMDPFSEEEQSEDEEMPDAVQPKEEEAGDFAEVD